MRKLDCCLCENKGADQLCSNCEADQRLCFRYLDSTIPLLLIAEISSLYPASVTVQAGLCWTWTQTPKPVFLASRLILFKNLLTRNEWINQKLNTVYTSCFLLLTCLLFVPMKSKINLNGKKNNLQDKAREN